MLTQSLTRLNRSRTVVLLRFQCTDKIDKALFSVEIRGELKVLIKVGFNCLVLSSDLISDYLLAFKIKIFPCGANAVFSLY